MRRARSGPGRAAHGLLCAAVVSAVFYEPGPALAETAWVKDEVRLNLRSGPGSRYRILASVGTGDAVEILERREEWIKVRFQQEEGWVPVGYLQPEVPARLQIERWKKEIEELRQKQSGLEEETERLQRANTALDSQGGAQREELERLTRENLELRAGSRWPEMVAGAGILAAGMILGAALQRRGRRTGPKIRI